MLLNSFEFMFLFFPIVICIFFHAKSQRYSCIWLLAASLVFYAFQSVKCLPLLLISILFNYAAGVYIMKLNAKGRSKSSRVIFILGLALNILFLGFFKYAGFIVSIINQFGANIHELHIILPPGISFFTITEMIYLVDVYQGVTKDKDPVNFAAFVSFFPHMLAGPILWHKPMVKQFNNPDTHRVNWENIAKGLTLFIIGLAKKIILADKLAIYIDKRFADVSSLTMLDGFAVTFGYTLQIYFDFSGYSDMAVGLAMMMNIDIPVNFNSPYKAYGMIDYWNRWHMSLTQVITNYIYTPILRSFSEITFGRAMFATFAAMLIAGIWHGAGWTFVIFGALHGLGLVLNHVWKKYKLWMPRPLGYIFTWVMILTANVFFRVNSVREAISVLNAMVGGNGILLPRRAALMLSRLIGVKVPYQSGILTVSYVITFLLAVAITFLCINSNEITGKNFKPSLSMVIAVIALLFYSLYNFNMITDFLYLKF